MGRYHYEVSAVNAVGGSIFSAPVDAYLPLPAVSAARAITNIIISWPVTASHFSLFNSTNLSAPAAWTAVTNSAANSNGLFTKRCRRAAVKSFIASSASDEVGSSHESRKAAYLYLLTAHEPGGEALRASKSWHAGIGPARCGRKRSERPREPVFSIHTRQL